MLTSEAFEFRVALPPVSFPIIKVAAVIFGPNNSALFIANFERVFVEYGRLIESFEIIKSVQKMEKVITLDVSNKNTTCEWITQNLIQSSHRGIVSH